MAKYRMDIFKLGCSADHHASLEWRRKDIFIPMMRPRKLKNL